MISKTFIFAFLTAIPIILFTDYIATISGAWLVPKTIFPFRLLGVIPIEDFIWGLLFIYSVVIFYEHFLNKGKHELIDKK